MVQVRPRPSTRMKENEKSWTWNPRLLCNLNHNPFQHGACSRTKERERNFRQERGHEIQRWNQERRTARVGTHISLAFYERLLDKALTFDNDSSWPSFPRIPQREFSFSVIKERFPFSFFQSEEDRQLQEELTMLVERLSVGILRRYFVRSPFGKFRTVCGPRSAMSRLVHDFSENDKIFRREKNAEKNERSCDFLISNPFMWRSFGFLAVREGEKIVCWQVQSNLY